MALKVKPEAQIVFFEKVFGPLDSVTKAVQFLVGKGCNFEQGLYTLKATYQNLTWQQNLTVGTTPMVNGPVAFVVKAQNMKLVRLFVDAILKEIAPESAKTFNLAGSFPLASGGDAQVAPATGAAFLWPPTPGTFSPVEISEVHGLTPADLPVDETGKVKLTSPGFAVVLNDKGKHIIETIKTLRKLFNLSLKAAKEMVDAVPVILVTDVSFQYAEKVQNALMAVEAGAMIHTMDALNQHGDFVADKAIKGEVAPWNPPWSPSDLVLGEIKAALQAEPKKIAVKPTGKVVDKVINLRDAKALGQKVHGSSTGSVYHTIALNDRVKLASRIYSNGTISIRVECESATSDELERIKNSKLQWKQNYGSLHLSAGETAPGQFIGAFVMGLGIKWDQVVTYAGDLVIDAKN